MGTATGSGGVYGLLDQTLWQDQGVAGHTREIGAFVLGGWSDPETNLVCGQLGGGISGTGLIPGRPRDVIGVGVTWGRLGEDEEPRAHSSETALDCFYKVCFRHGVSLKPDWQYIVHPSGVYPDAVVVTLRLGVDF
jgi:porin